MISIDELQWAIKEAHGLRDDATTDILAYPANDSPENRRLLDREYRIGLLISGLGQALRALTALEEGKR